LTATLYTVSVRGVSDKLISRYNVKRNHVMLNCMLVLLGDHRLNTFFSGGGGG